MKPLRPPPVVSDKRERPPQLSPVASDKRDQPPPQQTDDASDNSEQQQPQSAAAGGRLLQGLRSKEGWPLNYSPRPEVLDTSGRGRALELGDQTQTTQQNRGWRCRCGRDG